MLHFKLSFILASGWLLIVTFLLCIPGKEFPTINWMGKIWFDKWVHIGLFMIMVILWNRTFSEKNHKKLFRTIAILSILYGIIMELVQQFFIPFRSFEITDIAADTIGSFAGYLISMKWYIKNKPL